MDVNNMAWLPIVIGWIIGIFGIVLGIIIETYIRKGSFDNIFLPTAIIMWIFVFIGVMTI